MEIKSVAYLLLLNDVEVEVEVDVNIDVHGTHTHSHRATDTFEAYCKIGVNVASGDKWNESSTFYFG